MKKRVLIIDDEPSVGTLIRINLKGRGYEVQTVESGAAGIAAAEGQSFDLVILDVALPGMNGIEVCRTLREIPAYEDVPILMISSRSDNLTVDIARDVGASGYLVKPFTFETLLQRVEDLLIRPFPFETAPSGN